VRSKFRMHRFEKPGQERDSGEYLLWGRIIWRLASIIVAPGESKHSLRVGCANYPDFCENHQFHVIYCVTLAYVTFFEELFLIHDSRGFIILRIIDQIWWACAIFRLFAQGESKTGVCLSLVRLVKIRLRECYVSLISLERAVNLEEPFT
jgi:hypothetical protein